MNIIESAISPGFFDAALYVGAIVIKIAIVFGVVMLNVAYASYFERKIIGRMQVRLGPMVVGPYGLLQPVADGLKLFFKEDVIPAYSDKPVFFGAPVMALIGALSSLAVIPFFDGAAIANINVGLLFVLAMSSLGSYGIIMAGWASNSKYSFLGGLRSAAQVISYEIAMGLSLVGVMMLAGSLNLTDIVRAQERYPFGMFLIPQIIGCSVFVIAAIAETNRAPFDLPEAESELVAGYFVEYSGMRFGLFFAAEYTAMVIMASVGIICFLGGWNGPFAIPYVPFAWFAIKLYVLIFIYFWIRATLPRYRYDHLMNLGWKVLIPLALANIVITAIVKVFV